MPILRRRLREANWQRARIQGGRHGDGALRSAEVFYDTRFGAWNRQRYQAGVEIELTEHVRIEPYYLRQEDQRSSPAHLDRIGLVLKFYY
jgi:hypothetical protein